MNDNLVLAHFITCDISNVEQVAAADAYYRHTVSPSFYRCANRDAPAGMRYVPSGDVHISTRQMSDEEGMSEGRRYVQEFQLVPE